MNMYTVVVNGSPRDVLAGSPRVAVQEALKHVQWAALRPGYRLMLTVTVSNRGKMVRCHKWVRSGGIQQKCKVCGATRSTWGLETQWAYLNGKRQPYCKGKAK